MALSDYMTQTTQQAQTQAGQQQQQQQSMFNPQQQALQGSLGGFYNQLLAGSIPKAFTQPQSVIDAFNQNWDANMAPQEAAMYGSLSNRLLQDRALSTGQLLGSLYNTGVGNYMNALGGAQNYGFNSLGTIGSARNLGTTNQTGQNATQINPLFYMLMQSLGNAINSGIQSLGI